MALVPRPTPNLGGDKAAWPGAGCGVGAGLIPSRTLPSLGTISSPSPSLWPPLLPRLLRAGLPASLSSPLLPHLFVSPGALLLRLYPLVSSDTPRSPRLFP